MNMFSVDHSFEKYCSFPSKAQWTNCLEKSDHMGLDGEVCNFIIIEKNGTDFCSLDHSLLSRGLDEVPNGAMPWPRRLHKLSGDLLPVH
jgi:hypothetical protein